MEREMIAHVTFEQWYLNEEIVEFFLHDFNINEYLWET